jgi:hypothetical protein
MCSELQAPVRSIWSVALIEMTLSFCAMMRGSLT